MIGHLYRYPHPIDNTRFIYVGQGLKRDPQHRSGRSSFGRRFKKKFPDIELPEPIRWVVEVSNQQELNEEETIAMFVHHSWHGCGGMNMQIPGSQDYKIMGKLGIQHMTPEILTAACRKRNSLYGNPGRFNTGKNCHRDICSRNGKIAGQKAVESGRIQEMVLQAAQVNVGKPNPLSRERGLKMKTEKKGIFSLTLAQQKAACSRGGKTAGRINGTKNVASGHLARLRTPEHQQTTAWIGAHKRFHNMEKINPRCPHCPKKEINGRPLNARCTIFAAN